LRPISNVKPPMKVPVMTKAVRLSGPMVMPPMA
jgi:hypothetical protein